LHRLFKLFPKIIPFLHSKSYETRTAASVALSQIFSLVPLWKPTYNTLVEQPPNPAKPLSIPEFPNFSVQELMQKGKLLLASSGKEFLKPSGILSSSLEVKKARKEAMGRLGLDFLDSVGEDDMDIEKELAGESEPDIDIEVENTVKIEDPPGLSPCADVPETEIKKERSPLHRVQSISPVDPPHPVPGSSNDFEESTLSARERNRLKRKRKQGNSAFVPAPPPQSLGKKFTPVAAGSSNKYEFSFLKPSLFFTLFLEHV
jgi:TATA-binding protein-associated factor